MNRLLLKDGLRIGKRELELLQLHAQENIKAVAGSVAPLPAVITTRTPAGVLGSQLLVQPSGTVGSIDIQTGTALLANGALVNLSVLATVAVTVNVTSRPVVLKATAISDEPGTFALASDRVTLSYTPPATGVYAGLAASAIYQSNNYIRLRNSSDTLLGTFRIQTATTSTVILEEMVPGSGTLSGVKHGQAGKFFPGYPINSDTTELVTYDSPVVRVEVGGYTALSDEIILATVTRGASGAATVTDTRVPLTPTIAALLVTNAQVADGAAIEEAKLALSTATTEAKAWRHQQNTDIHTTAQLFRVRGPTGPRVLTEEDLPIIVPPIATDEYAVTAVQVSPGSTKLAVGGTQAITTTPVAAPGAVVTISYVSNGTGVATVNSGGVITGVAAGTTTITVSASSSAFGRYLAATVTASVTVTVVASGGLPQSLTGMSVLPTSLTLGVGGTGQLVPVVTANGGLTPTVTYVSAAPGIASVDSTGVVTGQVAGSTTVTVTATHAGNGSYAAATLTAVIPVTVTDVEVLMDEFNARVIYEKVQSSVNGPMVPQGTMMWGIKGSLSGAGPSYTIAANHDYEGPTIPADAKSGVRENLLYDSAQNRFIITQHSPISPGASFTVEVVAIGTPTTPRPGAMVIRSRAKSYRVEVLKYRLLTDPAPQQVPVYSGVVAFDTTYGYPWTEHLLNFLGIPGEKYEFRVVGFNSETAPTQRITTVTGLWGAVPSAAINVDAATIVANATDNAMLFTWGTPNGFSLAAMDFKVSISRNDGAFEINRNVSAAEGLVSSQYRVDGVSANEKITIRIEVTDPAGTLISSVPAEGTGFGVPLTLSGVNVSTFPFLVPNVSNDLVDANFVTLSDTTKTAIISTLYYKSPIEVVGCEMQINGAVTGTGTPALKPRAFPAGQPSSGINFNASTVSTSLQNIRSGSLGSRVSIAVEKAPTSSTITGTVKGMLIIHWRYISGTQQGQL